MSFDVSGTDYLDAIFAALRGGSRQLAAMKAWLASARRASSSTWRFQFLAAARAAHRRAGAYLDESEERLRRLGPTDQVPAPLDQLPRNVAAMRADLLDQERKLQGLETEATSRWRGSPGPRGKSSA
ncbi:uncharacterized protein SOCE26_031010 [Sorangium cellulosum]|uniref:Uncharacterized protein n=1 Tax=Sorangium cellulosum TaxID=56 RepID=A0A2L0EQV5_SORCE|nr:hypothetical protein [Sorangium cellulosum]AUX41679.1 uncharacterized protein SOCE26_031010 [Sorangium cellulosum]